MDTRRDRRTDQHEGLLESLTGLQIDVVGLSGLRRDVVAKKAANYLRAGMALLFGDGKRASLVLHKLSAEAVVKEAQSRTGVGSKTDFETLWKKTDNYVADLLNYSVWSGHWRNHFAVAEQADSRLANPGSGLSYVIREAAYADFRVSMRDSIQISLIASTFAAGNLRVRESAGKVYAEIHEKWRGVYSHILKHHKLRLRKGIEIDDLAYIFTSLADGLAMRMKSDPSVNFVDDEERRTLLGDAILAIVAGAVEKEDSEKKTSICAIVDDLLRKK